MQSMPEAVRAVRLARYLVGVVALPGSPPELPRSWTGRPLGARLWQNPSQRGTLCCQ